MRYVWFAFFSLIACSSSPDESTFSYGAQPDPVRSVADARPAGQVEGAATSEPGTQVKTFGNWTITQQKCEHVRFVQGPPSNRKDTTKENFCALLASEVATCQQPSELSGTCESFSWDAERSTVLYNECMARPVDAAKIPYYVESISSCAYGEDYDQGEYLNFPCRHRYACWRSIGLQWSSYDNSNAHRSARPPPARRVQRSRVYTQGPPRSRVYTQPPLEETDETP